MVTFIWKRSQKSSYCDIWYAMPSNRQPSHWENYQQEWSRRDEWSKKLDPSLSRDSTPSLAIVRVEVAATMLTLETLMNKMNTSDSISAVSLSMLSLNKFQLKCNLPLYNVGHPQCTARSRTGVEWKTRQLSDENVGTLLFKGATYCK